MERAGWHEQAPRGARRRSNGPPLARFRKDRNLRRERIGRRIPHHTRRDTTPGVRDAYDSTTSASGLAPTMGDGEGPKPTGANVSALSLGNASVVASLTAPGATRRLACTYFSSHNSHFLYILIIPTLLLGSENLL